ncbi:F-box domain, Skp2-like protein [Metarhizium guizhouense ARSEF 977]|uniref:F-box domain, Skp2-like protein n=1 Tax=Metarhizium guizhouense (strain ARSEF 977) TaxID=1276136 RepID=A0A0B4G4G3_METGA|nr:F-box domain, Skp2-like protein [Metarhizium guizhouense ARSEF 977]
MAAEGIKRNPLEKLPPETLQMICTLLPRADLKNLRLLSRAWDETPLPALLRTVYLRVHLQSFENLQDISRSEKLQKYVRYISYDGRTLGTYPFRQDVEEWMEHCACRGLGMFNTTKVKFLEQFTPTQLEKYYQSYQQYLFMQEHMLRRDYEKIMLRDALQNLPTLLGVEYVVPTFQDELEYEKARSLTSLSAVAQKILAEPESYHRSRESEGHFWTLLESACLSGHAHKLTNIRGSNIDLNRWNDTAASFTTFYENLPSLQDLSLEFQFAGHFDGETEHFATLIACASSLRFLRLSFDCFFGDETRGVVYLPQVITDDVFLQNLRRLSLEALVTSEAHLRGVLRQHRRTLRSLELSTIIFKRNACPDEYGSGSWVLFIEFLNREMDLDHVEFDGSFSNSWNEGWVVTRDVDHDIKNSSFDEIPPRSSDDRLLDRIKRLITGGNTHANPFTARSPDDHYSYGHNLPWAIKSDKSWYFEERLLQ